MNLLQVMRWSMLAGIILSMLGACSQSTATPAPTQQHPTSTPAITRSPRTPIIITMKQTPVPRSYFSLTMAISATVTELKVGETTSVTVIITNTGKLGAHQAYCALSAWFEDEASDRYFSDPIVSPWDQTINQDGIAPGEINTCVFALRAVRPGAVFVEGTYVGRVYFHVDGDQYVGDKSPRLKLHVTSSNP
jgi:hypothetical protein